MNFDTKETIRWIKTENEYWKRLIPWIDIKVLFLDRLVGVILLINETLGNEQINLKNVNGNEVYNEISRLVKNEK